MKTLLTAAALCAATSAHAITFTEVRDLDAPGVNLGALDLGLNTFVGFLDATCTNTGTPFFGCEGDSFDQFLFDVADGTELTAATLSATGTSDPGTSIRAGMSFAGDLGERYTGDATFGDSAPLTGDAALNLGQDTYFMNLSTNLDGSSATGPLVIRGSWTVSLTVAATQPAAVPLPAGALLLLTALGGLALIRRSTA